MIILLYLCTLYLINFRRHECEFIPYVFNYHDFVLCYYFDILYLYFHYIYLNKQHEQNDRVSNIFTLIKYDKI